MQTNDHNQYIRTATGRHVASSLGIISHPTYPISDRESLVQNTYWAGLQEYYKADITRVAKCDGYLAVPDSNVCILIECKYDKDLDNAHERAKVLAQCTAYMRRIVEDSTIERKPSVIFVGDVNECFAVHANFLNKFITMDNVDWSVAPSRIAEACPNLVDAIAGDSPLNENIFVSNPQVEDFSEMCNTITEIANNTVCHIAINKNTVKLAFEHFSSKVLAENSGLSANDQVGVFMSALKYPEAREVRGNTLLTRDFPPVKVKDREKTKSYFNRFAVLNIAERKRLEMFYDFLVDDESRRRAGFFITPKIWVDKAHEMVSEEMHKMGVENWYDDCIVWDCCCGTKALTRDYEFKNLFLSTLEQPELHASDAANPEAVETFQFDFLNDSLTKLPETLKSALTSGKKIVFLVNPPYGQASGDQGGVIKSGIKDTETSRRMAAEFGKASNELFAQFLFRFDEIRKEFRLKSDQMIIAAFSKPTWMSGSSFAGWRKYWLSHFSFHSGMMFNASEFVGCSDRWGVSFSIWVNRPAEIRDCFLHTVYENDCGEAKPIGRHVIHNLDGKIDGRQWAKGVFSGKQIKCVATTNGIKMRGSELSKGRILSNARGYFYCASSFIEFNSHMVGLFSTAITANVGFSVTDENFDRVCAFFAARLLVHPNWINGKDGYSAPDTGHAAYAAFVSDSRVYALFNTQSYQTSVAGEVGGEHYDFKNEFYPFGKRKTYELLGLDIPMNFKDEERFISSRLTDLSPEAQKVLDLFERCLSATAGIRKEYSLAHPELQVNRWDAGWRQLKGMFKEHCPDGFAELREAYRTLERKLEPMVYELGFLKK